MLIEFSRHPCHALCSQEVVTKTKLPSLRLTSLNWATSICNKFPINNNHSRPEIKWKPSRLESTGGLSSRVLQWKKIPNLLSPWQKAKRLRDLKRRQRKFVSALSMNSYKMAPMLQNAVKLSKSSKSRHFGRKLAFRRSIKRNLCSLLAKIDSMMQDKTLKTKFLNRKLKKTLGPSISIYRSIF